MSKTGFSFDVGTTLGIGTPDPSPFPEAGEGEIVLRVAEGLSLVAIRYCGFGRNLVHRQDWYEEFEWSREEIPPGTYRLRVPVPKSYGKTFAEQKQWLYEEEAVTPVAAVAAALLCLKRTGQPDPLDGRWTRCAEATASEFRVDLFWFDGRLCIYNIWDDSRVNVVGLSSIRRTS